MDRRKFLKVAGGADRWDQSRLASYTRSWRPNGAVLCERQLTFAISPYPFRGTTVALTGRRASWSVRAAGLSPARCVDDQRPQA